MTRTRRTTDTDRFTDNSDLTHSDLAAVVEALTGEPLHANDLAPPTSARRRTTPH